MADFSNKYGNRAKNLWRKVYGYTNKKPELTAIVDTVTSITYSIDLNKTLRHRDYYLIDGYVGPTIETPVPPPEPVTWEYEEEVVGIGGDGESTIGGTINFINQFSVVPIVVLSIESASLWGENLNIFGTDVTTTSFSYALSSEFLGTIRYRAIYSPTYPAYVTSAYTASITASAGTTITNGESYYTASFAALPATPFKFMQTAFGDITGTLGPDVAFSTQTSSSSEATSEISSYLSGTVHYIAFYE